MKFRAVVQLNGKTATGIQVPAEVVTQLGAGKRPPVRATINGYTYRSSVAPMGGVYMLSLSAENRTRAGVSAGDEVDVDLALDTEVREIIPPADFKEALERNLEALRFFESLSYSHKQRIVLSIESARTAETRARRIASAVKLLNEKRTA